MIGQRTPRFIVNGVGVVVTTTPGQSAATVATPLADVVNISPALPGVNIAALSMDAGTAVPAPGILVMLGSGLISLVGLNAMRRRRVTP